jgi:hypothetical protein
VHLSRFVPQLESLEDRALPSTLTVLNNLDSGAGSLRDAIGHAKSGDTIHFDPGLNGQTIALTSDELAVSKSLDIEGPGANLLAISGNDTFRVFDIVNQGLTVTIAGLTITHGRYAGGLNNRHSQAIGGAGIANGSSTLIVTNDVLSYNQATHRGGAISNSPGGVLIASNTTFLGNRAVGAEAVQIVEGGAIWNSDNSSSATVIGCTFIANQAIGADGGVANSGDDEIGCAYGGAIHNDGGSSSNPSRLVVEHSTFINNQAIGGNGASADKTASSFLLDVAGGGAIANHPVGGILAVSGCLFLNNQAVGGSNATGHSTSSAFAYIGMGLAGGVENDATATITDSAFVGNEALGGNKNSAGSGVILNGVGRGGGVHNNFFGFQATLTLGNCTFTNNEAVGGAGNTGGVFVSDGIGGGLQNFGGASATVTGTTFSGNQAIGGPGGAGQNGGDGLGGGIDNLLGSTLIVSGCTFTGNQAVGGAGGVGANGGNGFGGGIFNDGLSILPYNAGTLATLTVLGCTISDNRAVGGAAGTSGGAGHGTGGGVYFASGGSVCLDAFTIADIFGNTASTSNNDIFGGYTPC